MLCEICKQKLAMQTRRVNSGFGESEVAVCFECAKKLDFDDKQNRYTNEFWGESQKITKCGVCGTSIDQIMNSGYVGCSTCFRIFRNELNSLIQSVQGNNKHVGKVPLSIINKQDENADISKVMDRALDTGDFDLANIVRNHFPGKRW